MVNRGQEVHCEACIEGAHCCCERYQINSQDVHKPTSEVLLTKVIAQITVSDEFFTVFINLSLLSKLL